MSPYLPTLYLGTIYYAPNSSLSSSPFQSVVRSSTPPVFNSASEVLALVPLKAVKSVNFRDVIVIRTQEFMTQISTTPQSHIRFLGLLLLAS